MPEWRGSAHSRGYSRSWARASARYKQLHPICIGCLAVSKLSKTDVVDHIVPHKGNPALFWNENNWQPLCRWHHDVVKQRIERLVQEGKASPKALRLNSEKAIALAKDMPRTRSVIDVDGWPVD